MGLPNVLPETGERLRVVPLMLKGMIQEGAETLGHLVGGRTGWIEAEMPVSEVPQHLCQEGGERG